MVSRPNGKLGKAAALPKFSDTLTLSQSGGGGQIMPMHSLALSHPKHFRDYAPEMYLCVRE